MTCLYWKFSNSPAGIVEDHVSFRSQAVIVAGNPVLLTTRELLDLYFELLKWNISAFKMW